MFGAYTREGEARLGAAPCDELLDGVPVDAARTGRREAVEDSRLGMIQIRQPKHGATVVRLGLFVSHTGGLHCRSMGLLQSDGESQPNPGSE